MHELVREARKVINSWVRNKEKYVPNIDNEKYKGHGVFVTINKYGELRGCIGFPYPQDDFKKALMEAAISACHDPRFPPLSEDELNNIEVEVTLLKPPKKLVVKSPKEYLEKIEIGKHGLIVQRGSFSGLLLPQVAVENNWDVLEFLSYTCIKAGLHPNAWMDEDTEVYVFEGEVFHEKD